MALTGAGSYPGDIKLPDRAMKELEKRNLRCHDFHGEWNYTFVHDPP